MGKGAGKQGGVAKRRERNQDRDRAIIQAVSEGRSLRDVGRGIWAVLRRRPLEHLKGVSNLLHRWCPWNLGKVSKFLTGVSHKITLLAVGFLSGAIFGL